MGLRKLPVIRCCGLTEVSARGKVNSFLSRYFCHLCTYYLFDKPTDTQIGVTATIEK
jgi:transposase-like protein